MREYTAKSLANVAHSLFQQSCNIVVTFVATDGNSYFPRYRRMNLELNKSKREVVKHVKEKLEEMEPPKDRPRTDIERFVQLIWKNKRPEVKPIDIPVPIVAAWKAARLDQHKPKKSEGRGRWCIKAKKFVVDGHPTTPAHLVPCTAKTSLYPYICCCLECKPRRNRTPPKKLPPMSFILDLLESERQAFMQRG